MLRTGPFIDGDLTIGILRRTSTGCPRSWHCTRRRSRTGRRSSWTGLREVAVDAQALLDTVGRFCLVHSDVNPKNLLVDPDTLRGHRAPRLGVRPRRAPLHRPRQPAALRPAPGFVDAVLDAYVARHGGSPSDALELARAADLWALVDLAARHGQNPVADRAHDLLLAIARSRDPRRPRVAHALRIFRGFHDARWRSLLNHRGDAAGWTRRVGPAYDCESRLKVCLRPGRKRTKSSPSVREHQRTSPSVVKSASTRARTTSDHPRNHLPYDEQENHSSGPLR